MTDKPDKDPLDSDMGTPGQNSRSHAATKNQSSVTPDQYPIEEREAQVEASTGKPAKTKPAA